MRKRYKEGNTRKDIDNKIECKYEIEKTKRRNRRKRKKKIISYN